MRLRATTLVALAALTAIARLAAFDPNEESPAPASTDQDSGTTSRSVVDAALEAEAPQTTFGCGAVECTVGRDICCVSSTGGACVSAEHCPALADASVDASPPPPPLRCTSYRQCLLGQYCCFDAVKGSSCSYSCESPSISLCHDSNQCSLGRDCVELPNPPAPDVRQCQKQ